MLRARVLTNIVFVCAFLSFPFLWPRTSRSSSVLHRITHTSAEVINLNPSLSGDGRQIVFESTGDLAETGGGPGFHALRATLDIEPFSFAELGRTRLVAAGLSQDGSAVAFSSTEDLVGQNRDRNPEIFLHTGNQLRQLTNTSPSSPSTRLSDGSFQPSITDDGRLLVFSANRNLVGRNDDLNFEIFLFATATETLAQITDTTGVPGATEAKISGDGSHLIFINDRGESHGLVRDLLLYTVATDAIQTIAAGAPGLALTRGRAVSDNGLRVVYSMELSQHQSQVFLFETTTGSSRQITTLGSQVSEVPLNATISGDGKRVAFATRRRVVAASDGSVELYVYDIPTAEFIQLTDASSSATAEVVSSLNDDGTVAAFNFPRVLLSGVPADAANNCEIFVASVPSRPPFAELAVLNGASLRNASTALPLGGIVIGRGSALANMTIYGARTNVGIFPFSLAGTTVSVNGLPAQILYVSPTQVNFVLPGETQPGLAAIVITNAEGFQSRTSALVGNTAPGIFTLSGEGHGKGVLLDADTMLPGPFDPTSGQLRLTVFATGIRNASNVSCAISNQAVPVETFMPSPDLPGLDEIHLLVPADLRGAGEVSLIVTADGHESNIVTVVLGGSSLRDIVINEILADPPDGPAGDANHDGTRSAADDEFVELINSTTRDLDLSGYELRTRAVSSATEVLRHRFPVGTTVTAGTAVVVFGGGNLDPSNAVFAGAKVFRASTGGISLSNVGGVVTVLDSFGSIITSVRFGVDAAANDNQSLTRFPDITGSFILHTLAPESQQRAYSPGTRVNGAPFSPSHPSPSPTPTPLPSPSPSPSPSVTPSPSPSPSASPSPSPSPPPVSSVVISQVYGGGGNSGAPFRNDFIEIRNIGNVAVDLNGWSVQYASSNSTSWSVTNLTSLSLAPGQYYLIQEASGGSSGETGPSPDAAGTINLAATAGKVALVNTRSALVGACPINDAIVDLLGYGTTANCSEGGGPAPGASNTMAVLRTANGCLDTQNNASDFVTGAPIPRNSGSGFSPCVAATKWSSIPIASWIVVLKNIFRGGPSGAPAWSKDEGVGFTEPLRKGDLRRLRIAAFACGQRHKLTVQLQ